MLKRRGSRQALTLQDRLSAWANELRDRPLSFHPAPREIPFSGRPVGPISRLI